MSYKDPWERRHGKSLTMILGGIEYTNFIRRMKLVGRFKKQTYHRDRTNASIQVNRAIKKGQMTRGVCFCGISKTEGHHDDYTKPLSVIWLCRPHHQEADRQRRKREKLLTHNINNDVLIYNTAQQRHISIPFC